MAKYRVLELLSTSGPDIQPGAVIEIDDDEVASILLEKGVIKPAERQPALKGLPGPRPKPPTSMVVFENKEIE